MKNKSCLRDCRNQNICKHKDRIFGRFELLTFFDNIRDTSDFVNIISNAIGERCKYFVEFTPEEREARK